jgi:hypothetical protein
MTPEDRTDRIASLKRQPFFHVERHTGEHGVPAFVYWRSVEVRIGQEFVAFFGA